MHLVCYLSSSSSFGLGRPDRLETRLDPLAFGLEPLDVVRLLLREDLGKDAGDAELAGHGLGSSLVIPGHHDRFQATRLEGADEAAS